MTPKKPRLPTPLSHEPIVVLFARVPESVRKKAQRLAKRLDKSMSEFVSTLIQRTPE